MAIKHTAIKSRFHSLDCYSQSIKNNNRYLSDRWRIQIKKVYRQLTPMTFCRSLGLSMKPKIGKNNPRF